MGRFARKGVGQLLGMALLTIIIIYALLFVYARMMISLETWKEASIQEIYASKERLIAWINGTKLVVQSAWDRTSHIIYLVCNWMSSNATLKPLDTWVMMWRRTSIELPPQCSGTTCVVTEYGNLFCNATIPTKTITLKSAVFIAKSWLRLVPNYIEIPVNITSYAEFDESALFGIGASFSFSSALVPLAFAEGFARVSIEHPNATIEIVARGLVAKYVRDGGVANVNGNWVEDALVELNASALELRIDGKPYRVDRILIFAADSSGDPPSCRWRWISVSSSTIRVWACYVVKNNAFPILIPDIKLFLEWGWSPFEVVASYDPSRNGYAFGGAKHVVDLAIFVRGSSSEVGAICADRCRYVAFYGSSTQTMFGALLGNSSLLPPPSGSPKIVELTVLDVDSGWKTIGNLNASLYPLGGEAWGAIYALSMNASVNSWPANSRTASISLSGSILTVASWSNPTLDPNALDSSTPRLHTIALIAFDPSNGDWALAIARPMQIAIESTRRVAGWAEPGNLSITLTDTANHLAKHLEIEIGPNKTFDLDLDLPVATNTSITIETTEKTEASYALTTTIATHHTQTIIEYPPRPPPPPPPEIIIKETPIPTNSTPITVTFDVRVYLSGANPSEWSLTYVATGTKNSIRKSIGFTKVSSDCLEASFVITGNDRYTIFIEVDWKGTPVSLGMYHNYLPHS